MKLVLDLMRHGEALPAGQGGDRNRGLSAAGTRGVAGVGVLLAAESWRPDRVFSSPYRRAEESARLALASLPDPPDPELLTALTPETDPEELVRALAERGVEAGHVLLVAHQPLLGRLTAWLSGEDHGLVPGCLVRIECPQGLVGGTGKVSRVIEPG